MLNKHLSMWSMEYCIGVFVWELEVCAQLVVGGSVVVAGAYGERLLGVRCCVYVVFTVLHWLWAFSVVVRLVRGNGCVVWLKYCIRCGRLVWWLG